MWRFVGIDLGRERVPDETTVCHFDASIINAPSSTKNADKARDPEMQQTKKRNQWHFGVKAFPGRPPQQADPRNPGHAG
jgi:IS5 family transposase